MRAEVQKLQKAGVIKKCTSPWSAKLVLVRKPDGSWRVCSDYRKLNSVTTRDCYPLPRIDTVINALQGATWFSAHDMTSSFWQTQMCETDGGAGDTSSMLKTAFTTPEGQFCWLRMPFGLVNATAHQQRLMDALLAGMSWECVACYVDDCTVYSPNFDQHLIDLRRFYSRLMRAARSSAGSKVIAPLAVFVMDGMLYSHDHKRVVASLAVGHRYMLGTLAQDAPVIVKRQIGYDATTRLWSCE